MPAITNKNSQMLFLKSCYCILANSASGAWDLFFLFTT